MTMKVGDRTIEARIQPRDQAKKVYEDARREGRTASLLVEERPNLFTQSVANIMPGDDIEVHLHYAEELIPNDGAYGFVFRMVVGPLSVHAGGDADRLTAPASASSELRPGNDVTVDLRIAAGVEISDLGSPTHQVLIERGEADAEVRLQPAIEIPNR